MNAELHIQKLLRGSTTGLEEIRALGIRYTRDTSHPNLVQFAYHMTESYANKTHPIVRESRGLILDQDQNWNVVAFPFLRFFNWGEPGAAEIDWSTARVQEKLDGSLIILCHYAGNWMVSTKQTPGANCQVGDWPITFRDLFWQTFNQKYNTQNLIPGWTYCWELVSPQNHVITRNNTAEVTLLSARDADGVEVHLDDPRIWEGFQRVRHFDFNSAQAATQAAEQLDPLVQEGFVVVDQQFNRVKIKSPKYVALHYSRFSLGLRGILDLIRQGESDEAVVYFDEIKDRFAMVNQRIDQLAEVIDQHFQNAKPHGTDIVFQGTREEIAASRKSFAAYVKSQVPSDIQGAMFSLMNGHFQNARAWILNQTDDYLLNVLKLKLKNTVNPSEQ
jgi:hypothetical protein